MTAGFFEKKQPGKNLPGCYEKQGKFLLRIRQVNAEQICEMEIFLWKVTAHNKQAIDSPNPYRVLSAKLTVMWLHSAVT
jgi:hypothetical protein